MTINVYLHVDSDTPLGMSSNSDDCAPYRTLDIGSEASIFFARPEVARGMAELLLKIAGDLEQERNPCATA